MKIAHIHTETGWGGGEAQTLYLARALQEAGHECTLFVNPRGRLFPAASRAGLRVRTIPGGKFRHPASVLYLSRVLPRHSFDLCHYHTAQAVTLGFLALQGVRGIGRIGTRRLGYPLARKWFRWRGPWMVLDHVIAVSEFVRGRLLQSGVPPSRITVIHSAVDLDRFRVRKAARHLREDGGNPPAAPRIGNITRLTDSKGVAVFLEACARLHHLHPRIRFFLAGDGDLSGRLIRRANDLGLDGTLEWAGFREDIPEFLAGLDCLVFSPHPGVGSPGVLKEAMASGVPIVATDHPVLGEIVTPGGGAVVVPPGDPEALAQGVHQVLTESALARRLVDVARTEVGRFSVSRMVEANLRVYERVLSERKRYSAV